MKPWTIAIDGPAGAGKSTVARLLARRLGYLYIDSGAMYRAVALLAQRNEVSPDEADAVSALTRTARISFQSDGDHQRLFLSDEDITEAIRAPDIATLASKVSAIPGVRAALVTQQQALGAQGGVVMEGRDIGTVVFPSAELKVFLTATPEARAERRLQEIQARGHVNATLESVRADQDERDHRDATRAISPLASASDALEIGSDGVGPEQVVEEIIQCIDARRRGA
ncbi:MAG: (d)CMP kinase [Cytophagales bacterium]|nr:(d)CMP kinase [Armatimonadota bacterium]